MKLLKLLSSLESVCCHTLDYRGRSPCRPPVSGSNTSAGVPRCNLDQTPELPPPLADQSSFLPWPCRGSLFWCPSTALLPYPYSVSPLRCGLSTGCGASVV
ncbi:hypothetical protein CGRA01v4_09756 [Colletotrichum graminicola]|nr:hypothetical protein CGRA01v4_09756 [Colletotrichum graminicola]